MALSARKIIILAKLETSYGTSANPAAVDAVLASNMELTPQAGDTVTRDLIQPHLGASSQMAVNMHSELAFDVELAGSGTAGTAPKWGLLLRACGFTESLDTTAKTATYSPVSEHPVSLTFSVMRDNVQHMVRGARGTATFNLAVGEIPKIRFQFRGLYQAAIKVTTLAANLSAWKKPVPAIKANTKTLTLGGSTVTGRSLELALNNEYPYIAYLNAEEVRITDRQAGGTMEIEMPDMATRDYFADFAASQTRALLLTHGGTAGNIIQINAPQAEIGQPSYQDSEGTLHLSLPLRLLPSSAGNDEISVVVR